jgi:DNA-directed RNA polymerase specialized sigma24 family protein
MSKREKPCMCCGQTDGCVLERFTDDPASYLNEMPWFDSPMTMEQARTRTAWLHRAKKIMKRLGYTEDDVCRFAEIDQETLDRRLGRLPPAVRRRRQEIDLPGAAKTYLPAGWVQAREPEYKDRQLPWPDWFPNGPRGRVTWTGDMYELVIDRWLGVAVACVTKPMSEDSTDGWRAPVQGLRVLTDEEKRSYLQEVIIDALSLYEIDRKSMFTTYLDEAARNRIKDMVRNERGQRRRQGLVGLKRDEEIKIPSYETESKMASEIDWDYALELIAEDPDLGPDHAAWGLLKTLGFTDPAAAERLSVSTTEVKRMGKKFREKYRTLRGREVEAWNEEHGKQERETA